MDEQTKWRTNNDRYLTAALQWLRLRLRRLAKDPDPPTPPAHRRWWWFGGGETQGTVPFSAKDVSDEDVKSALAELEAAAKAEPPPAMEVLQRRFGLSDFERSVLLLCAAMELDTRVAGLCARAQDDMARPFPTFALAYALFDDPPWEALAPDRPLRYWRLIEINQPGSTALMASPLRADERIVNYIKGLNHIDDRLEPLIEPVTDRPGALPPSQQDIAEAMAATMQRQSAAVFQLTGLDPASKQLVASRVCEQVGIQLFRIPAQIIPAQSGELETFSRLWERDSNLMPQALYIDANETESLLPLQRLLGRGGGIFFCGLRETRPDLVRSGVAVEIARPTPKEQFEEWTHALGTSAGASPGLLASQFNLNVTEIRQISLSAGQDGQSLWDACLAHTSPRLESLAQRIQPKAKLNDVVLPDDERNLLRQIVGQVIQRTRVYDDWGFRDRMNRGLGISALFAGESGTGKTMAAEAIASELRLNLFRIDLSAVVNKYIGETEKNLRRLFDAAEDGGAILFFDEADALFGKRSEVKDSHDRYANIDINYLLQRLEAFGGLAILATNMKSALDQAFTRRLRFIVNFPFPGPKEREAIWRKAFPEKTPPLVTGLDYPRLAKFNLTGANIQSIVLNSAFLAAQAGEKVISMQDVLTAARTEFKKLDRTINEAEFKVTAGARVESTL